MLIALVQNLLLSLAIFNMLLTYFMRVLFILFAIPFYYGISETIKYHLIPYSLQKASSFFKIFFSIISGEIFDFQIFLIFNLSFEESKLSKYILFSFENINLYLIRIIINKIKKGESSSKKIVGAF